MKHKQEGQALVEMAIILPILLILITGIIEFGFVFNAYLTLNNASREAARAISVGETSVQASDRVNVVAAQLDLTQISVIVTPADDNRDRGDSVNVKVEYTYHFFTPLLGGLLGSDLNLSAESTMRVE